MSEPLLSGGRLVFASPELVEECVRRTLRPALRVACAWCQDHDPKEPNVSHTICADCRAKLLGSVGKGKGGS